MNNMRIFTFVSTLTLFLVVLLVIQHYRQKTVHMFEGEIFGTYYRIKIRTPNINKNIHAVIMDEFENINNSMSVFRKDSEINRVNQEKAEKEINLSAGLYEVLTTAEDIYHQSGGWFDPTIGKVVDLWGFGPANNKRKPTESMINKELSHAGFNKLKLKSENKSIRKTDTQTYINLSAIAKGYAVDRVAEIIENNGYINYLVDIGGEIRTAGRRDEKNDGWNIGIAIPDETNEGNVMTISLKNYSLATSGNYRNFYDENGHRYAHTISPFDGHPVETSLASVTVLHESCMKADAYATAMLAMGKEKATSFAEKHNLAAVFISRGKNKTWQINYSSAAHTLTKD